MGFFKGINVVSIAVPDLDEGRAFYRDVAEVDWQPSTGTTVVLNVEDCHSACARLRERGVRCEDPVVFPGFVTSCSFYDPFGNRLQMCSPVPGS